MRWTCTNCRRDVPVREDTGLCYDCGVAASEAEDALKQPKSGLLGYCDEHFWYSEEQSCAVLCMLVMHDDVIQHVVPNLGGSYSTQASWMRGQDTWRKVPFDSPGPEFKDHPIIKEMRDKVRQANHQHFADTLKLRGL